MYIHQSKCIFFAHQYLSRTESKIIENDPKNYKAWVLKGKAAAWQSTLANLRFEEAVSAFKNALDNTPENELAEVKSDVEEEISNLCRALNKLACGNYVKYPRLIMRSK